MAEYDSDLEAKLSQGKHAGEWCAVCPVIITKIRSEFLTPTGRVIEVRKEPCSTIMEEFERTEIPDSRCMASLQAKYNMPHGIQGSI